MALETPVLLADVLYVSVSRARERAEGERGFRIVNFNAGSLASALLEVHTAVPREQWNSFPRPLYFLFVFHLCRRRRRSCYYYAGCLLKSTACT